MNLFWKQLFRMFKSKYTPEPGENIIKYFDRVWIEKNHLIRIDRHHLVVTDKKLVLSGNGFGGYPGINFYFDKNKEVPKGFLNTESVIQEIRMDRSDIIINAKGPFTHIRIIGKERVDDIYNTLSKEFQNYSATPGHA